ncbi:alkyl hydroperoxide reductase [Pedobacter sp. HMWF019]|nr:alkyl hydroperoxide reductase [Pedobacter sp. HMWF019]
MAAVPFCAVAQQNYTITGKVKNIQYPAKVYMIYNQGGGLRKDSAEVKNGQFTFKGSIPVTSKAFVALKQKGTTLYSAPAPDQIGVYLENGAITITSQDSLVHARVGGTKLNQDQQELMDMLAPFKKQEAELNAAYKKAEGNDELLVKIRGEYDALAVRKEKAQIAFIKSHSNSVVSLNMIRSSFNPAGDPPKSRMLIGSLSKELQEDPQAVRFLAGIKTVKKIQVGDMAPQFSMNSSKDKMVSLESFKGKYVLLDFWASWCVPCRQENPNVVKAYNAYKDQNFTILGISIDAGDSGKKAWLQAIEKDGLPYEQLSDLKGSGNAAAILYQVDAIPMNFLIDPSGKIIARNLRGSELGAKLKEILSKSK